MCPTCSGQHGSAQCPLPKLDRIVALLESIDARLKSVIEGDMTVDVTVKEVQGSVTVETDGDRPLGTYEHRY